MDYYALLGIPRNAGDDAIRQAYRRLARQYHPDAGEGSSAEKFRAVAQAYETLIDPSRRRAYDLTLKPRRVPVRPRPEPMVTRRPRPMRAPHVYDHDPFAYAEAISALLFAEMWDLLDW